MAYSNVWTTTAPLDTQAANQGAVDFRATKLDVMQRIASFGAGTLAARPTPETTSGSADWTGVMYWATDTGQVFRWSGTVWADITTNVANAYIFSHAAAVVVPADMTEDTIFTATVPGGIMGTNRGIVVEFIVNVTNSNGSTTVRVKLGAGPQIVGFTIPAAPFGIVHKCRVIILNATNVTQVNSFEDLINGGSPVVGTVSTGIDTTIDQTLLVTAQKTVSGDNIDLRSAYSKLL